MKKLLSLVLLVAFVSLITVAAMAEVTLKKDNTNPPLGRFEIINIKTGGSGLITCSGETCTLDETNLTGVNWQDLNALGVAGVNWVGANIQAAQGVNWEALRVANGNTSTSVNWQAFGV